MFGISGPELFIIGIFALFLFGPDKIPEVMKTVKKALSMYNDARDQVTEVIDTQILSSDEMELLKDPLGMSKLKTSVDSMLTPERMNLINQTQPRQAIGTTVRDGERLTVETVGSTEADSIWASISGEGDKGDSSAD
jgi:Sec-independent protein translocase protein TatA